MEYWAHISERGEKQTNKEHLENTARRAGGFAEAFHAYAWGYCCGMLHDIGKYSEEFQKRIKGASIRVDHATAGAKVCQKKGGLYSFLSYCIAGHHAGLPDTGETVDGSDHSSLMGRLKKKLPDYEAYEAEITVPEIKAAPFKQTKEEEPGFFLSVFLRMLYSCLVDADFLDTEEFMSGGTVRREPGEPLETLYERLERHISGWLSNDEVSTINGRRSEILRSCIEKASEDKGLFRLTVPTGGGKTIASLAFALRHAVLHKMSRVIYVIPFTSIIEQNAAVFRSILGEENVLENHSNVDYGASEELKPMQLAAENWDKPIIVTTNVQFFESLFANRSSKCRKLHNIANSVIIFDEAQMLPNDYLKPCLKMMEQLLRHYESTLVLCTATQPALKKLFAADIKGRELCPRVEEQFAFFKRATIRNLGRISEEELTTRLLDEPQVLCILNTKKRVQRIYKAIRGDGVYHLSTSMYPKHRKRVLHEIRRRLEQGEKCVVIATSLVEAGVDLDFPNVYRQVAGVDSIIQAAGRCNREGKRRAEDSTAYVFQLEEREYVPGQGQQIAVTEDILEDGGDLSDLAIIQKYFEMLYHYKGESLDKKNILGKFHGNRMAFKSVGEEFKLIEEITVTVLIPVEERARELLEELERKGFSKKLMREAGQYCVQIYDQTFEKMNGAGMLRQVSEDTEEFYVLKDMEQYAEEMGLALDVESGRAMFL